MLTTTTFWEPGHCAPPPREPNLRPPQLELVELWAVAPDPLRSPAAEEGTTADADRTRAVQFLPESLRVRPWECGPASASQSLFYGALYRLRGRAR
eukprot:gene22976-biopygen16309